MVAYHEIYAKYLNATARITLRVGDTPKITCTMAFRVEAAVLVKRSNACFRSPFTYTSFSDGV